MYTHRLRGFNIVKNEIDIFIVEALFTTVTNVNFDPKRIGEMIQKADSFRELAKDLYSSACTKEGVSAEELTGPAVFDFKAAIGNPEKASAGIAVEHSRKPTVKMLPVSEN